MDNQEELLYHTWASRFELNDGHCSNCQGWVVLATHLTPSNRRYVLSSGMEVTAPRHYLMPTQGVQESACLSCSYSSKCMSASPGGFPE
ncbi:hypothetical protein AVEN_58735-1 [Araneus ventricosus]|uniref:Uncharacterized protein n=1 Tax=Araneus ventricosus TaxID=182803 RepID=A0A4Y2VAT1_ARAVE|nr:hypothetical protein AVEN_58735-1 [Araneus ventricosus]